jgi:hypothetical protein
LHCGVVRKFSLRAVRSEELFLCGVELGGSRPAGRRAGRLAVLLADLVSRRCPGHARDAGPAVRFALTPVVGQPITLLSAAAGECA